MNRTTNCVLLGFLSLALTACGHGTPKMSATTSTISKSLTLPSLTSQRSKVSDTALTQPESSLSTTVNTDNTTTVGSTTNEKPAPLIYAKTPKLATDTRSTNVSTPTNSDAKLSTTNATATKIPANKSTKTTISANVPTPSAPTNNMTTKLNVNAATQQIMTASTTDADLQYTPTQLSQNNATNPYLPPLEERPNTTPPTPSSKQQTNANTEPATTSPSSAHVTAANNENAATATSATKATPAENTSSSKIVKPTSTNQPESTAVMTTDAIKPEVKSAPTTATITAPEQNTDVPASTPNPATVQKPVALPEQTPPPRPSPGALNRPNYESPYGRSLQNNNAAPSPQQPKGVPPQSFDEVPVPVLN